MAATDFSRVLLSLDCALLFEIVSLCSGLSPGLEPGDPDSSSLSSFSEACVTLGKSLDFNIPTWVVKELKQSPFSA